MNCVASTTSSCVFLVGKQYPFSKEFAGCDQLRLQDLNSADIKKYVETQLSKYAQTKDVAQTITDNAQGIFLWARLVTPRVEEAFDTEDDTETIRQIIKDCPHELQLLYGHLLSQVDRHRRTEANFYFHITRLLEGFSASKAQLSLSSGFCVVDVQDIVSTARFYRTEQVLPAIAHTSRSIVTPSEWEAVLRKVALCTRGIVDSSKTFSGSIRCARSTRSDTHPIKTMHAKPVETEILPAPPQLKFVHRTASEYLFQNGSAEHWLGALDTKDLAIASFEGQILFFLEFSDPSGSTTHSRTAPFWRKELTNIFRLAHILTYEHECSEYVQGRLSQVQQFLEQPHNVGLCNYFSCWPLLIEQAPAQFPRNGKPLYIYTCAKFCLGNQIELGCGKLADPVPALGLLLGLCEILRSECKL